MSIRERTHNLNNNLACIEVLVDLIEVSLDEGDKIERVKEDLGTIHLVIKTITCDLESLMALIEEITVSHDAQTDTAIHRHRRNPYRWFLSLIRR